MLEVHTITWIEQNPGVTVTEIAKRFNRTTSSISQLVSRLEKKELLSKSWQPDGNKTKRQLHVTKKGRMLSQAHIRYDEGRIAQMVDILLTHFTMDEINTIQRYLACCVGDTFEPLHKTW